MSNAIRRTKEFLEIEEIAALLKNNHGKRVSMIVPVEDVEDLKELAESEGLKAEFRLCLTIGE